MPQPRIVIDTNVIVAGLRSKQGKSFQLLARIGGDAFDHCVSAPLLLEYEDVLKRLSVPLGLDIPEIDALIDYWCHLGTKTLIYFQIGPTESDPGDAKVLESAVAAGAEFIVTFNKRHFPEANRFGIQVVTPGEFLDAIGPLP